MFSLLVIFSVLLIFVSQTNTARSENSCYTDFDVRFNDDQLDAVNKSSLPKVKPHAQQLLYNDVAHAFLITANLALKLARVECRDDICLMAKYGAPAGAVNGYDINDVAYTALYNMPYGLRLLLCSDVIIRSIAFRDEDIFADAKHGKKIQTAKAAKSESDDYGLFKWHFEYVNDGDLNSNLNYLQFRIRNVKTKEYLIADRKQSLIGEAQRRIVLTDSVKSDIWQLKMIKDLNGNFNKFMIMNVPLGEYLYASRGFCYDNINNTDDCNARPSFTWDYETLQEAEDDPYNKFQIDEYVFDS